MWSYQTCMTSQNELNVLLMFHASLCSILKILTALLLLHSVFSTPMLYNSCLFLLMLLKRLPSCLLNLFFIIVWLVSDMGNKVLLIFEIIKVFAISIIINNDYSWLRAVFLTILHNCQLNNWNSKFKVHMQCLFDVFPGEVGTAGIETNCVFGFWV